MVDFAPGVLYVSGDLDYETARRHELTVTATDRVTGSLTSVPVTVEVTDVNDNAPQFEQSSYDVVASEAAHPGGRLATVTATDRDQGMYSSWYIYKEHFILINFRLKGQ